MFISELGQHKRVKGENNALAFFDFTLQRCIILIAIYRRKALRGKGKGSPVSKHL